jgi:hypothetical protein
MFQGVGKRGMLQTTAISTRQLVVLAICGAATIVSGFALRPGRAAALRARPGVVFGAELDPGDTQGCGGHSKKTLTDPGAASVDLSPTVDNVAALRVLDRSASGPGHPRTLPELTTYKVTARLVYAKLETDHDIHLVIQDPATLGTMIVEFPDPTCPVVVGTPHAAEIAAARQALVQAIGGTNAPRLFGTAEITGVGFFDLVHGQYGVAPNGIELHPALSFRLLTPASLGLRKWRAQRNGNSLAEQATIHFCALRAGRYRVIVAEHVHGGATRTFGRTIVQSSRCSSPTLSWQFPVSSPRAHDVTFKLRVAGGEQLQVSQVKTLP